MIPSIMDYRFVQNGLQIHLVQLKNIWDERDKRDALVITGLNTSLPYFSTMGRMGHLHF